MELSRNTLYERSFIMDFESIKRLGLDHLGFDADKSFETYDPSKNNHTINLYLLKDSSISCPTCGSISLFSKGSKSQKLKFASALEDNINLVLHRRVYRCIDCNSYFKEFNPFSESKRTTTLQKDIKILEALKDIHSTYTSVAKRFEVSPTYVTNLFDRKVDLKRNTLTQVICVDEVYSRKISRTSYCFVIYSPQLRKILDILNSRHSDVLSTYFANITINERDKVEYFSMDLYNNYRLLARKYFPKAKISADSFHVIKNLTDDFQKIRIRVMKRYEFLKDEGHNFYWLYKKYWKFLLIDRTKLHYNKIKVTKSGMYLTPQEIIEYMLQLDQTLEFAYELKEEYRNFNLSANIENASEWLDEIILKFQSSDIPEYIHFWKLLLNWHDEIINSFNTINGHRISNGPMERANRDIKTIFRISFGSKNFERTRNRIMYSMNFDAPILYYRKKHTNKILGKPRGNYKK